MDNNILGLKQRSLERFNRWSENYDRCFLQHLVFRNSHDMFLREINPNPRVNMNVLDVGCGTGEFIFRLAGYSDNLRLNGLDFSSDMIKTAKAKSSEDRINFKVGDAENLPYEDESFDVITCSNSFHHYPNQKKAVSEMHRVLKKRGRLMIVDGSKETLLGKFIFGIFVENWEEKVYHMLAREIRELFHKTGFRSVMQRGFNRLIPLLFTSGTKNKN